MKGFIALCLIVIAFGASSCTECTDCEPFTEEPFLQVRFFNQVDSTKRIIIIDSINQLLVQDFRHFQDTTYEYKFPVDMHHDTSVYQMVYRDTSNLSNYLTNEIILIYNRQFITRDDNYIIVECDLESFTADFAKFELICKDTSNIECISNEAVANIYN
jgi:hypothetical protein